MQWHVVLLLSINFLTKYNLLWCTVNWAHMSGYTDMYVCKGFMHEALTNISGFGIGIGNMTFFSY